MATNTTSAGGSATIGSIRAIADFTLSTYTSTGNNCGAIVQNIPLSTWTGLQVTESLSDLRYLYISNQVSQSRVNIATDSGGTQVIARLEYLDWTFIPWSGSTPLFAQAYNSASFIQTIAVES